jgi:hypothetical protein
MKVIDLNDEIAMKKDTDLRVHKNKHGHCVLKDG